MNLVPFPALRPYEVWFLPRDRTPLPIGQPMHSYDDACALATEAARDLPDYGICHGYVLVVWNASQPKILNTFHFSSEANARDWNPLATPAGRPRPEVIRLVLDDLRYLTSQADPQQAAPHEWIDRLHEALRAIAAPVNQRRYRLDGLYGVTMEDLFRSVSGVLRNFEQLVSGFSALSQPAAGEQQLSV